MTPASPLFISYSANHEDVILNRVFSGRTSGFYVDVGAGHPLFENDTKALYDRGWRGINVEPNVALFRDLLEQRPGDRNLNVAISDKPGEIPYHEVIGTGLSTCDPEEADRAANKGFEVVRQSITALTLRSVLEVVAPTVIDLLKVDVEGFELKVLSSNDWSRYRPRIVIAEATYPESPQRRDDGVEMYLTAQGYRRVYFDGLNDFYVERDFLPTAGALDRPLCVFDHYESYELHMLRCERENAKTYIASLEHEARRTALAAEAALVDVERARQELRAMHDRCRGLATQFEQVESEAQRTRDLLQRVYESSSWRITRPLRALRHPRRALRMLLDRAR